MADIKNPMAYFRVVVRNSYNDELRSDGKFHDNIYSVGDMTDIQRVYAAREREIGHNTDSIESQLRDSSVENWLLLMENERLYAALSSLPAGDVEFLLELSNLGFDQNALAKSLGLSKQAVSQHKKRVFQKIKKIF